MVEFEEIRNGCRVTKTMSGDDAKRNIFYMYDIEAQSRLKDWCDDYQHHFKIPEMLPGGPWCMMNSVRTYLRMMWGKHKCCTYLYANCIVLMIPSVTRISPSTSWS
jgi:hypothetical protein